METPGINITNNLTELDEKFELIPAPGLEDVTVWQCRMCGGHADSIEFHCGTCKTFKPLKVRCSRYPDCKNRWELQINPIFNLVVFKEKTHDPGQYTGSD